jgi:hypothetical protein
LQYSSWAAIDKSKRLPDNAEVDWDIGVARIPREWLLQIARNAMLGPDLSGLNMKTDAVELRVSADMSVSDLLQAARKQLNSEGAMPVPALSLFVVPSAPPLDVPEPGHENAQSGQPPSDPSPAVCISPETTIAEADLFNQQERIVTLPPRAMPARVPIPMMNLMAMHLLPVQMSGPPSPSQMGCSSSTKIGLQHLTSALQLLHGGHSWIGKI